VRSSGDFCPVRRTLLAAGVPVHINPTDVVLSEQRLVAATLLAVRALENPLPNKQLEELLTGPIGGADRDAWRRLIRALRRWNPEARGMDMLRDILEHEVIEVSLLEVLNKYEKGTLERIIGILSAGREGLQKNGSPEEVLWAIWAKTDL